MVKNFQKVIAAMQAEIDESISNFDTKKVLSAKRYLLEQAASEMLIGMHVQNSKLQSKQKLVKSSS